MENQLTSISLNPFENEGKLNPIGVEMPNIFGNVEGETKADNLVAKREQKTARLKKRTGLDTYDLREDISAVIKDEYSGKEYQHNMGNKILNDLSTAELDALEEAAYEKYGYDYADGKLYKTNQDGSKSLYDGDTSNLAAYYIVEGKDKDGYATTKYGTWGGFDVKDRYSDETFQQYFERALATGQANVKKGFVGPGGVNLETGIVKTMIMPKEVVERLEGLRHGSSHMIPHRAAIQEADPSNLQDYRDRRDYYGSGATEYYFNTHKYIPQEGVDKASLLAAFEDRYGIGRDAAEQARIDRLAMREEAERIGRDAYSSTFEGRAKNQVAALLSTVASVGIIDPADAVGHLFDKQWFGSQEEKTKMINDWFDYNPVFTEKSLKVVKEGISNLIDSALGEKPFDWKDVGNIIHAGLTTPEFLMQSIGAIFALVYSPGTKLKGTIGVATRTAEKELKAGKITPIQAKAKIAEARELSGILEKTGYFIDNNAGYLLSITGMSNDNIQEFKENNNGNISAGDYFRIIAATAVSAGLDRFTGQHIMTALPGGANVQLRASFQRFREALGIAGKAAEEIGPKFGGPIVSKIVQTGKYAGSLGLTSIEEAAAEITQEILDTYATKANSAKYNYAGLSELLGDRKVQVDVLSAGAMGAIQGPEMRVINPAIGVVLDTGAALIGKTPISSIIKDKVANKTAGAAKASQDEQQSEAATVEQDKAAYAAAYRELVTAHSAGLTSSNLAEYADLLTTLETTRYAAESAGKPEIFEKLSKHVDSMKADIRDLILNSEDGAIELSHILARQLNLPEASEPTITTTEQLIEELKQVEEQLAKPTPVNKLEEAKLELTAAEAAQEELKDKIRAATTSNDKKALKEELKEVRQAVIELKKAVAKLSKEESITEKEAEPAKSVVDLEARKAELEKLIQEAASTPAEEKAVEDKAPKKMTKHHREMLVETLVETVLESVPAGQEVPEALAKKLEAFGKANGVPAAHIQRLIKNYAAVETETWEDYRGIKAKRTNLLRELNSGTTRDYVVRQQYKGTRQWYETTAASIAQLQRGIEGAKKEAAALNTLERNKSYIKGGNNSKYYSTEYMTHEESSSQGKPFKIVIKKGSDGIWAPILEEAEKRISVKKKTMQGLSNLLNDFHNLASTHLHEEDVLSVGGYHVAADKENKFIKSERNYVSDVNDKVKEVFGPTSHINKVILGDTVGNQWKIDSKGQPTKRRRQNSAIINTASRGQEYSSDDVVYVHALGLAKGKNGKYTELYSTDNTAAQEIAAAIAAGATIVLANDIRAFRPTSSKKTKGSMSADHIAKVHSSIVTLLKQQGYVPLGTRSNNNPDKATEANIYVPAKDAETNPVHKENKERFEKSEADAAAKSKAKAAEVAAKTKLMKLFRRVEVLKKEVKADPSNVELSEKLAKAEEKYAKQKEEVRDAYFSEQALKSARREVLQQLKEQKENEALAELAEEDFEGAIELSEEDRKEILDSLQSDEVQEEVDEFLKTMDITADADKNLDTFIANRHKAQLTAAKDAVDAGKAGELEGDFKVLFNAYQAGIRAKEENVVMFMLAWADAKKQKLSPKELEAHIKELAETFGVTVVDAKNYTGEPGTIALGGTGDMLLRNSLGKDAAQAVTARDPENTEGTAFKVLTITHQGTAKSSAIWSTRFSKEAAIAKAEEDLKQSNKTVESISVIPLNPNDYLRRASVTPLNSIPISMMPEVVQTMAHEAKSVLKTLLKGVQAMERTRKGTGKNELDHHLHDLVDSPARGLIYSVTGPVEPSLDGKADLANVEVNETVAAAMAIAVRDMLVTDQHGLLPGAKDDVTVANMFKVQEHEVTDDMRSIASEYGMLRKTAANSVGKAILTALGISRSSMESAPRGHYESLASDLGNTALQVAIKQGLLIETEEQSDKLAEMYRDGEVTGNAKIVTKFIKMTTKDRAGSTLFQDPSDAVVKATDKYKRTPNTPADAVTIDDIMPDVVGRVKAPTIGQKLSEEEREKLLSSVRNDDVGAVPNEVQRETLSIMMDTPYTADVEGIEAFLALLDDPDTRDTTLGWLGYVETSESNPTYAAMLHDDKVIQESKNKDVLRSVEALQNLVKDLNAIQEKIDRGEAKEEDKHIYFGAYLTKNDRYNINSNTINPQTDKLHRFFIQPAAMKREYEIDKANGTFTSTINNGDGTTTSINSSLYVRAALAQAFGIGIDKTHTQTIVDVGNVFLSLSKKQLDTVERNLANGEPTTITKGDLEVKIKPDHISHAYQAIKFLRAYHDSPADKMTAALSVEMDALTSGYSNKMAQIGISGDTNIAGLSRLQLEARKVGVIVPSLSFDLKGDVYGMNDALADGEYKDPYQESGAETIEKIGQILDAIDGSEHVFSGSARELFKTLAPALPGGTVLGQTLTKVDSTIRSLFKGPFMTFNYSASLKTIKKSMSRGIAKDTLTAMAALDVTKVDTFEAGSKEAALVTAAEVIAGMLSSKHEGLKGAKALEYVQGRLRTEKLSKLTLVKGKWDPDAGKTGTGKNESRSANIIDYLADKVISPTYGNAMEEVFNAKYSEFIRIQDLTNDAFNASFQVFNEAFTSKVRALRRPVTETSTVDGKEVTKVTDFKGVLTEQDVKDIIAELAPIFPAVAGPLQQAIKEGETEAERALKDNIFIYDSETRNIPSMLQTDTSPRTILADDSEAKGKKTDITNPVIRSIIAAVNAGAVLPIQAIDGAQMSRFMNSFYANVVSKTQKGTGVPVIPVHDAIVVSPENMDIAANIYNGQTVDIHLKYNVLGEILNMLDRSIKQLNKLPEYKAAELSTRGLRITSKADEAARKKLKEKNQEDLFEPTSFKDAITSLRENVAREKSAADERRNNYFTDGVVSTNLVGLAGGGYRVRSIGGQVKVEAYSLKNLEKQTAYLDSIDYEVFPSSELEVSVSEKVGKAKTSKSAAEEDSDFDEKGGMTLKAIQAEVDKLQPEDFQDKGAYEASMFTLGLGASFDMDPRLKESNPLVYEASGSAMGKLTTGVYYDGLFESQATPVVLVVDPKESKDMITKVANIAILALSKGHLVVLPSDIKTIGDNMAVNEHAGLKKALELIQQKTGIKPVTVEGRGRSSGDAPLDVSVLYGGDLVDETGSVIGKTSQQPSNQEEVVKDEDNTLAKASEILNNTKGKKVQDDIIDTVVQIQEELDICNGNSKPNNEE